jgi:cardiolipin synthase A/B
MTARLAPEAPAIIRRARRLRLSMRPIVYSGNRMELLVNGEQYFPRLLAAIGSARRSIHLETYIFSDDNIGTRVTAALAEAAQRGVQVRVIVDGYGGGDVARRLVRELGAQGAQVRIYRAERWWRLERKLLRRLHRKLVVIDDSIAFVGGINIIDDHNHPGQHRGQLGPRFDFAVACVGPIVAAIALAGRRLWWTLSLVRATEGSGGLPQLARTPRQPTIADGVSARLLLRDNLAHRRSIEHAYIEQIDASRVEIIIANAYFLPGRRFRTALRDAAARGVKVRLLLQGRVEYALQHYAQQALYGQLLDAGIEIHEYLPSYLHAKVAVVDSFWATVGSSNIDPYSLLLAREANVAVYDAGFARQLREVLQQAIEKDSVLLDRELFARRGWITRIRHWAAYVIVRFATVVLARGRSY